jgi:mRNA interferase HigB
MRIISKKALVEFWEVHPEAKAPLLNWYNVVRRLSWEDFTGVRTTFRHADTYRDCVVFNIGGNKYRLIVKIRYRTNRVFIRFVMTHSEYDKDSWKEDCEC